MSAENNKAFIERYLTAINGKPKSAELLDQFIANQDYKNAQLVMEAAVPCFVNNEPMEIVAEGDLVMVQGWVSGENLGPGDLLGVSPTGKPLKVAVYETYKIGEGKIIGYTCLIDALTVWKQLGIDPNGVDAPAFWQALEK